MDENKWKSVEKSLDNIPSLSPTVTKVIAIANDLRSSPRDLLKVISLDPVLTGKVLKLINSAYFGIRTNITSLNRALIMLGVNTIKNLALSTAVLATMEVKEKDIPLDMDEFWTHSLGTAVGAKVLAAMMGVPETQREEYFISGLLHDIGKIPLLRFFPDDFRKNVASAEKHGVNLYEAEELNMSLTHGAIGAELGNRWRLTPSLIFTIEHHHDPMRPSEHKQINQCVFAANNYCKKHVIGASGNKIVEDQMDAVLADLHMTEADLEDAFSILKSDIQKARVFLQIAKE